MIGQPNEEATNPTKTKPKQETKEPTRADQSMKGETSETGSRSHYLVQNTMKNPGSHNLFSCM